VKTQATDLSVGNLAILGDDFRRSLRAANKSPKTRAVAETEEQVPGPRLSSLT
jgi:hypothetical protein